jgi:hypothetical protein
MSNPAADADWRFALPSPSHPLMLDALALMRASLAGDTKGQAAIWSSDTDTALMLTAILGAMTLLPTTAPHEARALDATLASMQRRALSDRYPGATMISQRESLTGPRLTKRERAALLRSLGWTRLSYRGAQTWRSPDPADRTWWTLAAAFHAANGQGRHE